MKQNKSNWRQSVTISKLPKMLLFGIIFAASSITFAQTSGNMNYPMARMTPDNDVTIRTGLHETYKIPVGHFGFSSTQEANTYFQTRDVDYIDFVVVDVNTVLLQLDLNNPAVAGWTINDWNLALIARSTSVAPRAITN